MNDGVTFNPAAFEELAKSANVRLMVDQAARKVAEKVEAQGITVGDRDGGTNEYPLPVRVQSYTTDRAGAAVVLAHPAGAAVQAKHGVLTKAAAELGLDVRGN